MTTPDRYVPDKNPNLPCQECGREERWQDIKASGDWQVSNDPDVPFLCPDCQPRSHRATPVGERQEMNHAITEFSP